MQEVIEQLRHLSSAEDFLRFFDIAFDEKVVNVSRLHILKRFFQCIEQQKELPCNNATAVLAVYRCLLQKADNDFVASTPAEQEVFKVFLEADGRRLVLVDDLRASLPARGGA
ncbi:nitrogenase-stabilizing/protective protein [Paraburkholderia sp. BL8N3]|nr:nitrogenase-stabilizing/protective protein NifW [Paraburkholderia sp. BL8N3]TCK31893.1 nitrogenase-stabilizing/protective protein [Paraburkholderia sp. BL8N3]